MDLSERIALFRNMAESDPENELAHFNLGKLSLEAGDAAAAEASLRRTIELNSQHAQAHRWLAEALFAQERGEEALALLDAGARLAHLRGEYAPRNAMLKRIEEQGGEPPALWEDEDEDGASDREPPEGSIRCARCLRIAPALEEPPFRSEIGKRVHESICQSCWAEWMALSVKVINEYRLNLATEQGNQIFKDHMAEFLGLTE